MAVIALSVAVLIGWQFNIPLLKSILPDLIAMNPFTAIGFIAVSVWQLLKLDNRNQKVTIIQFTKTALSLGVLLLGLVRLLDIAFDSDYSLDDLLYAKDIGEARISPLAAFNFTLCGLAMMILSKRIAWRKNLVILFMTPIFIVSIISFFGYLISYNNILTLKPFVPMALHTSICFLALVANYLFLFPQNVFTQILISKDSGGYTARKLFPYIFIVPLVLGFLRYHGERLGLYDAGFGVAIIVVGFILIFLIVVLRQSQELHNLDIERREAEIKVEQRSEELLKANLELEKKNQELEQFSYAASHDMQEPLRKVQIYSSFLLQNNFEQVDEKGKGLLKKIEHSVQRMKTIIDDLLQYSHQSKDDQQFVPIDLYTTIENIETDLELQILQKGASIVKDKLPVINGVPTQIHQLFFNLISNALKFSKPGINPRIHITAKKNISTDVKQRFQLDSNKNYVQVTVSDNGIGFQREYAEQIFSLFSRLHSKAEFEGTGIGLALCKKVAINHGGTIWAESELNHGSTFHVLL